MEPATELAPDVLVLTIEIDHTSSQSARHCWTDAHRRARNADRVVFDLQRVKAIDRLGVASLVRCLHKCQARGSRIALCNVSPETLVVLELNGVPHLTIICDTPSAAMLTLESTEGDR